MDFFFSKNQNKNGMFFSALQVNKGEEQPPVIPSCLILIYHINNT